MAKITTSIDFITKSRKRKERANVEKARKWKFLYSLFKSHPSPKALRTCLDLPCRRSCKPPASQWPSPSQCCWPWWCSAPAPRAPWAVSCLPATAIWKASHFESDGESAHCVLSEGQDWLQIPQTLVHGTRLEKTEATAVVHELLQQTFQLFSTTGSSAGREESLLDRFLVGLDQQLEDLDACLREGRTLEESPLGSENSRLAVKGYFQRISVYLKEKEYSRCAWEVVSVEIRRCLVLANKLIRKLRK